VRLELWSMRGDPYTAPELNPMRLQGVVYGHSRKPDGKRVTTSHIVAVQGRCVKTNSGTVYRLGTVEPAYRAFLREHRPNWDWRKPITIIEAAT